MKRKIKILAATILIVVLFTVTLWLIINNPLSTTNCDQLRQDIENDFKKANFCTQDADCKTVTLGGPYIRFGCDKYVNKQTNEEEIFKKMGKYYKTCLAPIDECIPPLGPVCFSGKCISPCEKDEQFAESVSSSPECQWQAFRCMGGGSATAYYDSRLTNAVQTEIGAFISEEVENAAVAFYYTSSCSCINPVAYEIIIKTETRTREKTECEYFYTFVQDFNTSCNGCLLSWVSYYE